jgi:hypothetical protein
MTTARVVVTLITAVITAAVGVADLIPAGFVLANSAKVHVPRSLLQLLGAVKLARSFRTAGRSCWPAGHRDYGGDGPGVVLHRRADRPR